MRRKMVRKKMEQKNNIQHDGVKSIRPNGFPSISFLPVKTRAPSHIHLEYCNALMGKIINNDLKNHVEIISHGNARAYRWKTKLGEN
jgi:hypothetical protein